MATFYVDSGLDMQWIGRTRVWPSDPPVRPLSAEMKVAEVVASAGGTRTAYRARAFPSSGA